MTPSPPSPALTADPAHRWLKSGLVMITTMRSEDARDWRPERLVELARSFSLDALGFSVGGVTAFYPTRVAGHPVSPSLAGRDLVAETVEALHRAGIRAMGRIDPSLGSAEELAKYPDRFARDAKGEPMRLHDFYLTCPNGAHYGEFMLEVVREIMERYPLDGLWANAAQFSPWSSPRCWCDNCLRVFREAGGGEALPAEDWRDPAWKRYSESRYASIADWNRRVKAVIDAVRPACAWLPLSQVIESWDHIRKGGWDVDLTAPHADGVVLEAQRRYCNLWWPGMESRYAHAMDPERGAGVTISYFYPWWRFTHAPVAENRVWAAQIMAHGARPWLHLTGFMSERFDRRGIEPMRELFRFFKSRPELYERRRSGAQVALVYSRRTVDYAGGADPDAGYLDGFRGAYNALMDDRIPFDLLSDRDLTAERLARYQAVLLPNLACLSDETGAELERYVSAGGHLVATYRTGFCDEWGRERREPWIARLTGARYTGRTRHDLKAAYAAIERRSHPLLAAVGDTDLLPLAGSVCEFEPGEALDADVFSLIPPVEARAGSGMSVPEFNAAGTPLAIPLLLTRRIGRGSVVYLPWEPDRVGFHFGLRDLLRLVTAALRVRPGWTDQVRIEGPGLVDLALMDAPGSRVLHVINFNSHAGMRSGHRRAIEEVVPLHDLRIELALPEGAVCDRVELAVAGREIDFQSRAGRVTFTLPLLREFESIAVHHHRSRAG
jgi:hypothetical protein